MKSLISLAGAKRTQSLRAVGVAVILMVFALGSVQATSAQTAYKVLHAFLGQPDGVPPISGLIRDAAGNFYGTTESGGSSGFGVVFKVAQSPNGTWTESVLHSFAGSEGKYPAANLVFDNAGNLYGTAILGGMFGEGTVFKLAPTSDGSWTPTVLYNFTGGADGGRPYSTLIFDGNGDLYGTTSDGGTPACTTILNVLPGCGVVFKLTPNSNGTWAEQVLHSFTGAPDGVRPVSGLIFDTAGNLYGTTPIAGDVTCDSDFGCGVVYKLIPNSNGSWTESVVHTFSGTDGDQPFAGLVFDAEGNLFGTTQYGGDVNCGVYLGCGVAFRLTPNADGSWTESVIHRFSVADGARPSGELLFDAAGNLYGTTQVGGTLHCGLYPEGCGVVFKLSPTTIGNWTETPLHNFTGTDGAFPAANVVADDKGRLYSTFAQGKLNGCSGSNCAGIFRLSNGAADLKLQASASPSPASSHSFFTYTFSITNNGPDPSEWPRLVAHVPYGTVFNSYTMSVPGYCLTPAVNTRGDVTCRYHGTQPVGSTWTVTLKVWAWAPGTVVMETAATWAATHDPNTSNNTVTITTSVH